MLCCIVTIESLEDSLASWMVWSPLGEIIPFIVDGNLHLAWFVNAMRAQARGGELQRKPLQT
eukprot:m.32264 g.32264  ORF g.32264 m.32264 type:complete len:62 (+) comp10771_c0_seq1:1192-1377(+)